VPCSEEPSWSPAAGRLGRAGTPPPAGLPPARPGNWGHLGQGEGDPPHVLAWLGGRYTWRAVPGR
jgi:hypothetical protein